MQKALLFFLAVIVLVVVAYSGSSKEGFTTLMGVNWTSMNEGTPKACYTDLPIKQPKTVAIAEAGVGNIQPSPPPAADLPSAPFGQRSKEVPNPYKDPTNEPAKYIRILAAKEDLQAFFAFDVPQLDGVGDPALQIPLTRARADMKDLIDIQSVMERNPGLPSRINTKQLDDITSNLQYLRAMVRDLQNSGAIQQQAIESFVDYTSQGSRANLKELQDFQVKLVLDINKLTANGSQDPQTLVQLATMNRLKEDVDQVIAQLQGGLIQPSDVPIFSTDLNIANLWLGKGGGKLPINTGSATIPKTPSLTSDKRATLQQLQEFQIRTVVELKRLSASGTSDPVVMARTNVLQKIKNDVDQVILNVQRGQTKPENIPIFAADLERAFPVLGNPTAPLPTLLKEANLPSQWSSLFPNGMSPNDTEQMQQINNIVKGYGKQLMDGASWQVTLKYDNPNIEMIRFKTASETAKLVDLAKQLGYAGGNQGGLPGVAPSANPPLQAKDPRAQATSAADMRRDETNPSYGTGLPGLANARLSPAIPAAPLDWKQRNREITQQIRRRGLDPIAFGGLPESAEVSKEFSWRGHTQMMCTRLNQTADPGLGVSVGCPPQNWEGWRT